MSTGVQAPRDQRVAQATFDEPIPGVVYYADTGHPVSEVAYWVENGVHHFRSVEFPFLIASADSPQEAVNAFVFAAIDFVDEVVGDLGDDRTQAETEAAATLAYRFMGAYAEREKQRRRRRLAKFLDRRRPPSGIWRAGSRVERGKSAHLSPA